MGERRRATEFSLWDGGQGQVRPEEKRDDPEGGKRRDAEQNNSQSWVVPYIKQMKHLALNHFNMSLIRLYNYTGSMPSFYDALPS